MRFSVTHLLLLVTAVAFAIPLSPWIRLDVARVTYHHDVTSHDLRSIRTWAVLQMLNEPGIDFAGFDRRQMAMELDFMDLHDPWGNPYQFVERDDVGPLGSDCTFHAFSMGADGTSVSNGNDVDDINTWSYDRSRYYRRQIAAHERQRNLWRTAYIAPIVYLALLFMCRTWVKPRSDVCVDADPTSGYYD